MTCLSGYTQTSIISFNFDNDSLAAWTFGATGINGDTDGRFSWEIGIPSGGQGYNDIPFHKDFIGNADPISDHTGISNVAGQGLFKSSTREGKSGHYNNSSEWIQSPSINCKSFSNVNLEFYRWANFQPNTDTAFVEVSNDAIVWYAVYVSYNMHDTSWVKQSIDISKYADREPNVFIRWRSVSDDQVFYSGWNIDDITVKGLKNSNDYTSSISTGSIQAPLAISSLANSYEERVSIGSFIVKDAGSGDGFPTIIDTLVITPGSKNTINDWKKSITNLYLINTSTGEEISGTVLKDKVYISNPNVVTIQDGASQEFEIKAYLETYLPEGTDNNQFEFVIDYGDIVVDPSGSFINSGVITTGTDKLQVNIDATQLTFLQETQQLLSVGLPLVPTIVVAGTDINGNIDADFHTEITLLNSDGLGVANSIETTVNGVASFSDFYFTETGGPVNIYAATSEKLNLKNAISSIEVVVEEGLNENIFFDNFDNSRITGWTSGANYGINSWSTGNPSGGFGYNDNWKEKGRIGNPDPTDDHSIDNTTGNVWGQGNGKTSSNEGTAAYYNNSEEWLMSPAIDLTNYYNTVLSFSRWANFEPYFDSAFVEISTDGSNWIDLEQPLFPTDKEWVDIIIDIATIADRQSTVYLRWRSVSDGTVFYSGWNLDDVSISGIYSPVINWTGQVSSDWNDAANWDAGMVPDRMSNVFIDQSINYPLVSGISECNEIIIKKNGILEIASSGDLTVYGDVTIETDDLDYGSFIDRGTVSILGNGIITRYLKARQWQYVSIPVGSANSSQFGEEVYGYNEPLSSENWLHGWELKEGATLIPALGYNVYKYKATQVNLTGDFNSGTYTVNLTNTDGAEVAEHEGWNFIGNPYPSAIDWDAAGWTKTNINDAIYVWDDKQQNFVTYVDGVGANGGSNFVPPMQGFFVKVTNPGAGILTMTNQVRATNTQSKFKSAGQRKGIKIRLSGADFYDEAVVRLSGNASDGFDNQLDAYKKFTDNYNVPQIYSKSDNNEPLSINTLSYQEDYKVIPIFVKLPVSGDYNLDLDGAWNVPFDKTVYLEDALLDTLIDLRETTSYSFYSEAAQDNQRFVLHVGMPLTIKYSVRNTTGANSMDGSIDLTIYGGVQPLESIIWSNGAETEKLLSISAGYYIVSITDGAGNTIIDTILVNYEGQSALSIGENSNTDVNVFANDNVLHISTTDYINPVEKITVYNINGVEVFNSSESFMGSAEYYLSGPSGIYIVRILQNARNYTKKIYIK